MNSALYIFILLYFIAICMEVYANRKQQLKRYDTKDSILNISLGLVAVGNRMLFGGLWLALWLFVAYLSPFHISQTWYAWVLLFLLNEFVYYWFHRWSHEWRFLWAIHVNHHSSQLLNLTTAARLPFFNILVHILFWTPLVAIGFDPKMVFAVSNIGFLFGVFQHTQFIGKLGWLEFWFNTPLHHRIHHARNPSYINHNYGNVLIIFDRMFGTFIEAKEEEEIEFGITKNIQTTNPVIVVFHEWKDMFLEKFRKEESNH
jgi:sterol desaturase/sphingolipid hydroxylase (fatty acid hydroxylase superfamily)